jgi:hypothetical protein
MVRLVEPTRGSEAASSSRQAKARRSSRRQSGYQGAELQLTSEDEGMSDAAPQLRHKESVESLSSCFDEEIMLSDDDDADTTLRQSAPVPGECDVQACAA